MDSKVSDLGKTLTELSRKVEITDAELVRLTRDSALKITPLTEDERRQVTMPLQLSYLTDGLGPHIVIDAVGLPKTFTASLELVRRGGKCVMVGVSPPATQVPMTPYTLFWKELTIIGSHMRLFNFQRTIDLLPRLQIENLLMNFYSLENLLETIKSVENNRVLKPLVQPV